MKFRIVQWLKLENAIISVDMLVLFTVIKRGPFLVGTEKNKAATFVSAKDNLGY